MTYMDLYGKLQLITFSIDFLIVSYLVNMLLFHASTCSKEK